MAVKLHRCSNEWVKIKAHPCWRVQKALNDMSVEYELVKHSGRNREDVEQLSGQRKLPFLEFDDGRVVREESKDLEAKIRAGELP